MPLTFVCYKPLLIPIVLSCLVYTRHPRLPRLSQKAVNRWHVAVTLLRNPSLIKYRKQGGVTSAVSLGSIYADLSALVLDGASSWPEI